MEPFSSYPPLVVIVGQTASGKTALSLELARRFQGEIIAADSRTVYRDMDIGTAKPTPEEMAAIPHHLINVVDPNQPFNAHVFKKMANDAIKDISIRGKLPILVGGTGLYVDSVIYDFDFSGRAADAELRTKLAAQSVDDLRSMVIGRGLELPPNDRNPRHLIRTLERNGSVVGRHELRPNTVILGKHIDQEILADIIIRRVHTMVEQGLIAEVEQLGAKYGWHLPALQAPAYKSFRLYIAGQIGIEEAERLFVQQDLQYAKRQKTWFKRNKSIQWISETEEAVDIVTTLLSK